MKDRIYRELTNLRDIKFMPKPIVNLIDWIRYEFFIYKNEK